MQGLVLEIRRRLAVSQETLAKMLGFSFATVNRWENGHSSPNEAAQLRLYEVCRERSVDLEDIIRNRVEAATSAIEKRPGKLVLYHGSKSGITGPIAPVSRPHCDFGRGFYMGSDPYQPLTLICDFEHSKFYVMGLDLTGLKVLRVKPDIDWAMLVAFHRGRLDSIRGTALYERYESMADGFDVIAGCIADDRMFYVLDNFFLGNITDQALTMSLSALQPGEQYVAITERACAQTSIEQEIELSHLERAFLRDMSQASRAKGTRLATEICRNYRRQGMFFDELLEAAAQGRSL